MTAPLPVVAELLTERACVMRIPGRDADVRAWLRTLSGVRRRGPTGLVLYVWPEVLARLPLAEEVQEPEVVRPAPPVLVARRATLVGRR